MRAFKKGFVDYRYSNSFLLKMLPKAAVSSRKSATTKFNIAYAYAIFSFVSSPHYFKEFRES